MGQRSEDCVELELLDYSIDRLDWGPETRLAGGSLCVSLADLQNEINRLSYGIQVDYALARPGESKRIVHVLDTVLPIAKFAGEGSCFPGFGEPAELAGTGHTMRIANLLVTITGCFPHPESLSPIERPREGIIDMAGVGADYSYGSDRYHLIMSLTADRAVSNATFDQTVRMIALRAARYLAEAEKSAAEPERRTIALFSVTRALPKVVLIYQVQSQVCGARKSLRRCRHLFIRPNSSTAPS
jgi:glycine reductase